MDNKFVKFCAFSILGVLSLAVFVMIGDSLLRSTYFPTAQEIEIPLYRWDKPVLILLGCCILVLVVYWVIYRTNFLNQRLCVRMLLCIFCMEQFCVVLLRAYPSCDSSALSVIAAEFVDGNYAALDRGGYLYIYPFQLGMTSFIQVVYGLFGKYNYMALQIINILGAMGVVYALYRITQEIFEDEHVHRILAILAVGMLPLHLYTTFIYGNILGLCFSLFAMLHIIYYMKRGKWQDILVAGLGIGIGILFKTNSTVFLIAMEIILILYAVLKKRANILIACLVLFVLSQIPGNIVDSYYEKEAGIEQISGGIPKVAWIAMGLQEDETFENGWYNAFNLNTYQNSDYNAEITTEQSILSIQESLGGFFSHPTHAVKFFYKKWSSQWNDPTYQSLFSVEWSCRHNENQSELAKSLYAGRLADILYWFMNIYQTLYFITVGVFCVKGRKNFDLCQMLLLLSVFGGMLCHLLWEAKGRYVFSYYVVLLPFAAYGMNELMKGGRHLWAKSKGKS